MEANDVKDGSMPLVSLVVPVKDSLKFTKLMMETYREATLYPNKELIFVDNGSTSATGNYLREQSDIDVIVRFSHNTGFAAGVNAGIEEASGEYIAILNNDILLTSGWLKKMLRVMHTYDDIAIVSPLRVGARGEHCFILPFQYEKLNDFPDHSFTHETDEKMLRKRMREFVELLEERYDGQIYTGHTMLPFFCVLLRRAVFDKVGMLDEDFGVGLVEDTYFCRLLTLKGYRLASCLDLYVHHFISRTLTRVLGTSEAMHKQMIANYALMNRKLAELNI